MPGKARLGKVRVGKVKKGSLFLETNAGFLSESTAFCRLSGEFRDSAKSSNYSRRICRLTISSLTLSCLTCIKQGKIRLS